MGWGDAETDRGCCAVTGDGVAVVGAARRMTAAEVEYLSDYLSSQG